MTMRQVVGLLRVIGKVDLVEFYHRIFVIQTAHQRELPSLEEFLSLASAKEPNSPKVFDEKTDKFLEEQALKRFTERQKPR